MSVTLRRGVLLLAMLAAAAALFAAHPSRASAGQNICTNVTLAGFGRAGDRCFSTLQQLFNATIVTHERAGCVSVADGANNITMEWRCGARGSSPSYAAIIFPPLDGVARKGVIRNNAAEPGRFDGHIDCYVGC